MWEACETWRLRTPAPHAPLLHWATLIRWRCHIYDVMVRAFAHMQEDNGALYSMGFKDKSWSVNTLAMVARKHGQPAMANRVITTLYQYPTMEARPPPCATPVQCIDAYSFFCRICLFSLGLFLPHIHEDLASTFILCMVRAVAAGLRCEH